jgi:hypothetical protein
MTNLVVRQVELCVRLRDLGYAQDKRIRIYGEEFDLTSNPSLEGEGVAVEAVSRKSGTHRRLRIPVSVVRMVQEELELRDRRREAA